jgi:hypothetical protein
MLSGCGATPYQSEGIFGGYSDWALEDENTFSVMYSGNGDLNLMVAREYALLRCAVLTKEKGFEYFEILEQSQKLNKANVGTGAANIYVYKPTVKIAIKLVTVNSDDAYNAKELISNLTTKHDIAEY